MNLEQLKKHFLSFPKTQKFQNALSRHFILSDKFKQVAFAINRIPSSRGNNLSVIEKAIESVPSEYDVCFEEFNGQWTGGKYSMNTLEDLLEGEEKTIEFENLEEELVSTAFSYKKKKMPTYELDLQKALRFLLNEKYSIEFVEGELSKYHKDHLNFYEWLNKNELISDEKLEEINRHIDEENKRLG